MSVIEQTTWIEFIGALIAVVLVYYIVVMVLFKIRPRDLIRIKSDTDPAWDDQYDGIPFDESEELFDELFEELSDDLGELSNRIRFGILDKAGKNASKEELLLALRECIASYRGLHKPAYQYAISNFIISHAKKICGVDFEEDELEALWDGLRH